MKSLNLMLFVLATHVLMPAMASAADKADDEKAKTGAVSKPAAKPLCDDQWEGGFWTVAIDEKKYDGNASNLKDYDPKHPDDPWQVLSDRYFGLRDCCGNVFQNRFLGRFLDRKQAEAFLRKIYADSAFAKYLNPRFPAAVTKPDALLVSDHYTCKLDRQNDNLRRAEWIVEIGGQLFAGGETACKQGKKKKTVTVVDCAGAKTVVVDTLEAPCEARITSCLHPLPDQAFAVDHAYTQGGEGTSIIVRAYDLKKKQRVFSAEETNDGGPDAELMSVQDVDGDGVPEVVHRVAGTDEIVSKLQWRNRRFVKVTK